MIRVIGSAKVAPDVVREMYHRGPYWVVASGGHTEGEANQFVATVASLGIACCRLNLPSGYAVLSFLPHATWTAERVARVLHLDAAQAERLAHNTAVLLLPDEVDGEQFLADVARIIPKPEPQGKGEVH